jgi:hypothetical protein
MPHAQIQQLKSTDMKKYIKTTENILVEISTYSLQVAKIYTIKIKHIEILTTYQRKLRQKKGSKLSTMSHLERHVNVQIFWVSAMQRAGFYHQTSH